MLFFLFRCSFLLFSTENNKKLKDPNIVLLLQKTLFLHLFLYATTQGLTA